MQVRSTRTRRTRRRGSRAIEPLRPPAGAPNVLVVLLDDVGFGASSAFGGPCATPTAERLAANGLKYNRFHTTALCSPTRQALLTGRNHHSVGMGGITEIATSAPGYNSIRPNTAAPLAETLKLNGYSTAQFGKCHEVPVWETSPLGPFNSWPTGGGGFEHFYGFIGGETNQYAPAIYDGTTPIEPDRTPEEGYHFTEDMTDRAIDWIRQQKALMPDKPFFVYFAPGATHAPHHVPPEWSDKYKGRFDDGWDALRERTLARQKELGIVPEDAELTERAAEIPAWDDMPDELKPVLARQMEVYAGFLEHTDHHIGRLIDALDDLGDSRRHARLLHHRRQRRLGRRDAERLLQRARHPERRLRARDGRVHGLPDRRLRHAARVQPLRGRMGARDGCSVPVDEADRVALGRHAQRDDRPLAAGIRAKDEVRSQFHHVIDIAATVLDAAGLPEPATVHGIEQMPLHGVSMTYSFDDASAAERRTTQYFEMFCNRGIYHEGWTAVTRHSIPWMATEMPAFADDVWELYGPDDWTQAHDLADEEPDKLAELQRLFLDEARKYNVLPLDDRRFERFNPDLAGRPQLVRGTSQLLFGRMGRLSENSILPLKNKSHAITAEIVVPEGGANGVILSQGGAFGGFALYAKDGRPAYCYNLFGLQLFKVYGEEAIPAGEHQVRMEFTYDGGGLGKGGAVTLFVDGEQVGQGRVEATVPMLFSADETTDVGSDTATPVSDDYGPRDSEFTGRVRWVQLDIDESAENLDHLISPEERLQIAMARQ